MFANLTPMLWVHFIAVLAALGLGAVQLVAAKGGVLHRQSGRVYVVAMLLGNAGALTSYRGGVNIFHVFAIVSLVSLALGMLSLRAWLRRGGPARLRSHQIHMAFSYLGLVMAGVSQALTNPRFGLAVTMSPAAFWGAFAAINIVLYGLGSWAIFARLAVPRTTRAAYLQG